MPSRRGNIPQQPTLERSKIFLKWCGKLWVTLMIRASVLTGTLVTCLEDLYGEWLNELLPSTDFVPCRIVSFSVFSRPGHRLLGTGLGGTLSLPSLSCVFVRAGSRDSPSSLIFCSYFLLFSLLSKPARFMAIKWFKGTNLLAFMPLRTMTNSSHENWKSLIAYNKKRKCDA